MSDQRIAEMYERLTAAKFKIPSGRTVLYPFQLGWNAAIDQAIKLVKLSGDEIDTPAQQEAAAE